VVRHLGLAPRCALPVGKKDKQGTKPKMTEKESKIGGFIQLLSNCGENAAVQILEQCGDAAWLQIPEIIDFLSLNLEKTWADPFRAGWFWSQKSNV